MPVHAYGESNSLSVCQNRKTDIALGNAEMKQVKDALFVRVRDKKPPDAPLSHPDNQISRRAKNTPNIRHYPAVRAAGRGRPREEIEYASYRNSGHNSRRAVCCRGHGGILMAQSSRKGRLFRLRRLRKLRRMRGRMLR